MRTERGNAGASMYKDGLLVTGGRDASRTYLKSTEVLTSEGWVAGPDLPVAVDNHCQVTVGSMVYDAGKADY